MTHSLSVVFLRVKVVKCLCMFFFSGEHLGADVPGVFSPGDDQHGSLHHHGKKTNKQKTELIYFCYFVYLLQLTNFSF